MKIHRCRPQPNRRRRSRGQSLVELALVTPILLSLLVIAIDHGDSNGTEVDDKQYAKTSIPRTSLGQ